MKGPRLAIVLLSVWNILVWLRSTKAITVFRSFGIFIRLGLCSCIEHVFFFMSVTASEPHPLVGNLWPEDVNPISSGIKVHTSELTGPLTVWLLLPKKTRSLYFTPISESQLSIIEYGPSYHGGEI